MDLPKTIKETQAGLLAKRFRAVDLVEVYVERIGKYDQSLNSFIKISLPQAQEKAFEKAREVDKIIDQLGKVALERYPLLGVVVSHKDLYLTKGITTTAGSQVLKDYVPAYSSTVVDRLNAAGAVIIGKTNCDAWAHGASGERFCAGRLFQWSSCLCSR